MAFDYTDAVYDTPLLSGVCQIDQSAVREALARGFSANLPDNRGWTPVHEAATDDRRIDCLKLMISHPSSNINSLTFQGETALFIACENDCLETVKLLVSQPKCDVNLSNLEEVSPLHLACSKHQFKTVQLLIRYGADINSRDFNGYTPLHETVASVNGVMDPENLISSMVFYLLNHGSDPDFAEYEGNYPLHFACQNGLLTCVDLLLKASKLNDVINCCNNDGRSPFMMAVASKNVAVLEYLLNEGANPNFVDKYNLTALHLAAHTGNFKVFSTVHLATSNECLTKYCTFDEERDYQQLLLTRKINSVICLAIDVEDLEFLNNVLNSGINVSALHCPVIHAEMLIKKSFTLHTPISFLLESKMLDLGERTVDFLSTLIEHGSPLKMTSKTPLISYVDPVCAVLVALNECRVMDVINCLKILLYKGADPDLPYGRMPFSMEQACMRSCKVAVLILLHYSNVLEPEDILKWIEKETSSNQEEIIEALLPLAPYYIPGNRLVSGLVDGPRKTNMLKPRVHSLANYCRSVIRKQLHEESKEQPTLFKSKLLNLGLPQGLYPFLCYE